MNHSLDNPIWTALNSDVVPYVFRRGNAVFIDRKMGFFAGLPSYEVEQLDQLYAVMDPGMRVILFTLGFLELDAKWKVRNDNALLQMVFESPSINLPLDSNIRALAAADVPDMLALTQLAKPGPFLEKTIDFGGYFGYFVEGRLGFHGGNSPGGRSLHRSECSLHASRLCGEGIGETRFTPCSELHSATPSNSLPSTLPRQPTCLPIVSKIGICGASQIARLCIRKIKGKS